MRRTTGGAAGSSLGTTIKYLRGAASSGLGTTMQYLMRIASGAAGNGLGTTNKYVRGAAGSGLGTMIKYLRRTTRQRLGHHDQVPAMHNEQRRGQLPGHHDQLPATHNERRRGQRPEPAPGIADVPLHRKRPHLLCFVLASFACKQNRTAEVPDLGAQCVCLGPKLARCVHDFGVVNLNCFARELRRQPQIGNS
jgi:hypothetical protein